VQDDTRARRPKEFRFGIAKGQAHIHPAFFDPMTEEELEDWYGKPGEPFP
jgi:hypothetical protein